MVTHDTVQRTGFASALTRAFEDGRRILFSLPCYHMFGYVEGLLAALFVGGAIIPQTSFSPEEYLPGIERHRATEILCVPTMTVALLEHPGPDRHDLSSLFAMLSGAAPAPLWLWDKCPDNLGISEITTGYGMTEAGGAMTLTLPEDPLEVVDHGGPRQVGRRGGPPRYGRWRCVTTDSRPVHRRAAARGPRASWSCGPTLMLGFWDKPEETARGAGRRLAPFR